jgi:hypothetical protein
MSDEERKLYNIDTSFEASSLKCPHQLQKRIGHFASIDFCGQRQNAAYKIVIQKVPSSSGLACRTLEEITQKYNN